MSESLKAAVLRAVMRLMVPLARLLLEAGVGAGEFHQLTKRAYVRAALGMDGEGKLNISRLSVRTGIIRAEIAAILKEGDSPPPQVEIGTPRAARVLRGWWSDIEFRGTDGSMVIPLRGPTRSFSALVMRYGGGLHALSILRELLRVKAVRKLPNQRVEALSPTISNVKWEDSQVERTGECMRDLLNTLLYNLQHPSRPRYARFVVNTNLDPKYLPILTRDIAQYSESLADSLEHTLNDPNKVLSPRNAPQEAHRLGVGIFLVHDQMEMPAVKPAAASAHRKKGRRKL